MFKQYSSSLHDYWFIEIKPTYRRYKYGFLLNDGMEEQLFIERAFFNGNDETVLKDVNGFFDFPYLNPEDVFQPLKWVKETKWYQIFPEWFANGNPAINPGGALPWGEGEVKFDTFYGGDLQGIIDHLEELGVNGLYLTPIFESS